VFVDPKIYKERKGCFSVYSYRGAINNKFFGIRNTVSEGDGESIKQIGSRFLLSPHHFLIFIHIFLLRH